MALGFWSDLESISRPGFVSNLVKFLFWIQTWDLIFKVATQFDRSLLDARLIPGCFVFRSQSLGCMFDSFTLRFDRSLVDLRSISGRSSN